VALVAGGALVVLGAVGAGVRVWRRTRASAPSPAPAVTAIARGAGTTEPLRWPADPRAAVIRAYGEAERTLAEVGLPRGAAETPREYLARVRAGLGLADADAAATLTGLYEQARFGAHAIHPAARAAAIHAAERLREGEPS
jgi:hypothetical protein